MNVMIDSQFWYVSLCGVMVADRLWKFVVTRNVLVLELFDAVALVWQAAPMQALAIMLDPHCSTTLSLPTHITECFIQVNYNL